MQEHLQKDYPIHKLNKSSYLENSKELHNTYLKLLSQELKLSMLYKEPIALWTGLNSEFCFLLEHFYIDVDIEMIKLFYGSNHYVKFSLQDIEGVYYKDRTEQKNISSLSSLFNKNENKVSNILTIVLNGNNRYISSVERNPIF